MNINIENYFKEHYIVLNQMSKAQIINAVNLIADKFQANKKIFTCGNGGSASTASHYITDWNKMINLSTMKKFRGFSLTDNVGLITAFANDISYSEVYSGQLKALADSGDLLVVISGSGNSENLIKAVDYANCNNIDVLAVVGYDGGKLAQKTNNIVHVPSFDMQICEDIHLMFGHIVMKHFTNSPIIK